MQTCGAQGAVFTDGKWRWFPTIAEAARFEAEDLYRKVEAKKQRGGVAILVGEQIAQYEAARSDARNITPGQK